MDKKRLHVVYVRPSRYDDDGYVVRFWRGVLPSNTLCCLESLTQAIAESGEVGAGAKVTVEVYDDTVERIPVERLARLNRQPDTRVVIGFAGVQSNQFVRATDLALQFRAEGVQVMIGGFHVSGMLALFDKPSHELQALLDKGVSLVKGEAEAPGALAQILRDALQGRMKPIYDIVDMPDLFNAPVPRVHDRLQRKFFTAQMGTIDTSRGCPFDCSFCTIINVQGRKMRYRSAELVLQAIEENHARGVTIYFLTDDNFARNPVWEQIFDGLIAMRQRGIEIIFMMQTDTQAYRIPRFIEKASQAGCYLAFIGMESVNAENLDAVGKKQNRTGDYAAMVNAWHEHNILVHVGYIIGLPFDTRASVNHDIDSLRNKVKVDLASFFMLTPLPGSRDHQQMIQDCVCVDADHNNYDGLHETFKHPRMPVGEWRASYDDAMSVFYSKENIVTALLCANPKHYWELFWSAMWYRYSALEGIHPMATGLFRRKERISRRPIFPRENVLAYVWRRTKDTVHGLRRYGAMFFDFQEIWMLTRKPQDPRWATLRDLRTRWAEIQVRVAEYDVHGHYDDAAQEIKAMLTGAAERMTNLSQAGAHLSRSARRNLRERASEVDTYLRAFDVQPGWRRVVDAERFVSERLLAGYEEAVIHYVASRRRFNEYRNDFIDRIKTGRILTLNVSRIPYAMFCELAFACRFTFFFLAHR